MIRNVREMIVLFSVDVNSPVARQDAGVCYALTRPARFYNISTKRKRVLLTVNSPTQTLLILMI